MAFEAAHVHCGTASILALRLQQHIGRRRCGNLVDFVGHMTMIWIAVKQKYQLEKANHPVAPCCACVIEKLIRQRS